MSLFRTIRTTQSPIFHQAATNKSKMNSSKIQSRTLTSYLVPPPELASALKKNAPTKISTLPRTIPLCATWFLPNDPQKRDGYSAYIKNRIPTSRFFDLDKVCDKSSEYPHMLPTAKSFASVMSELGVKNDDTVVVYDSEEAGIFSAPRVAWTLRVFGHTSVGVLNNFKKWTEDTSGELAVESGEFYDVNAGRYTIPEKNDEMVASFEEIVDLVKSGKLGGEVQLIDARSSGRFNGTDEEPRKGLSSGHIPGSINIPISDLLDPVSKAFLPVEELRKVFEGKGVSGDRPIITSCGTGVTAAVVEAALLECGIGEEKGRRIYDGSWT